jgi:hypothetical protein
MGVPCITLHEKAMSWEVTRHDFTQLDDLWYPDRTQWAHDLAYAQWSPQEIEDGSAWDHLRHFEQLA